MSEVYLAEDPRINQQVAIKICYLDPDAVRLFEREAKAIASLDHPHILPLIEYGEKSIRGKTLSYIVMPYRPEGSLYFWLQQPNNALPLSPQNVAHFLNQAADALQYAHDKEIIHRDVKPSNFLIRDNKKDPSHPDLLLVDFGIARLNTATSKASHTVRGTFAYMAPEQWNDDPVPATDQYALAIMAYELITGCVPFQGNEQQLMYHHLQSKPQAPSIFNQKIPLDIDTVVLCALAKKPEDRFASVSDFADAFKKAASKETITTAPLPPEEPSITHPGTSNTAPLPPEEPSITHPGTSHGTSNEGQTVRARPWPENIQLPPNVPGRNPRRFRAVTIALVVLVLLLILSSGIFYGGFTWKTNLDNTNATATAGTNFVTNTAFAKATTHANFTATANVQTTANAITIHDVTATALANTSQYPFSYTPHQFQLRDVFPNLFKQHTNNDNWDDNDQCKLTSVGYLVMSSSSNQATTCFAGNTKFTNFTYELHFQIIKGDCAGIIFRASSDEKNFYSFMICQNGSYMFVSNVNGSLIKPSRTGTSLAIAKGLNSYSTIGVVARGNQLSFYIYQGILPPPIFLFSVPDNKYSQGSIGVIVNSLHNKPTQVLFLGTKVWSL